MRKLLFGPGFLLALVLTFSSGCDKAAANMAQQGDPPQAPLQTQPAQLAQVFTLATSSPATYSNPSGALELMPIHFLVLPNAGFGPSHDLVQRPWLG